MKLSDIKIGDKVGIKPNEFPNRFSNERIGIIQKPNHDEEVIIKWENSNSNSIITLKIFNRFYTNLTYEKRVLKVLRQNKLKRILKIKN